MIKSIAVFIVALLCLAFSVTNAADIIYVDAGSPNDPGTGTSEDPFRRIQDAINFSISGDTVEIRPGVYTGSGNYDLDPIGKSIAIRSTNPENDEIAANTIIDPANAGRGFYIHSGEDANCVISGFTIKNAYTYGNEGAGIYCYQSNPTIANCIIIDNYAEGGYGGAICCKDSNSLFENCTISNNSAYDGGALECWSGRPTLINCIISNNLAVRYGGGVDCYYQSSPELVNCTIANNIANPSGIGAGGTISLFLSNAKIKNSILWANDANMGSELYLFISSASISFSDIQGGISDVCSQDSNVIWGSGNIDIDPCFASFDPNGDPNVWDFHLKSTSGRWNPGGSEWVIDANLSQCIDAGDPNSDWSVEPWPNGKRINMGAYGGTNQASKSGLKEDFDIDGFVDFVDFSYLASKWNLQQSCIEDLDGSGDVDIYDLKEFCVSWLTHN